MRRRDFVKAMMAASASMSAGTVLGQQQPAASSAPMAPPVATATPPPAVAPGPVPWMRGLMEVKPLPISPLSADTIAQANAHFFNGTQWATFRRLSEILMPPFQGYPGATEAGTPEFLDFLIGVSPADRQQLYRSGLDRLESEAQGKFGVSFAAANAEQADQLIRPWLRTWMTDHPPTEPYEQFINVAHHEIRTATMNSQAWSDVTRKAGKTAPNTDLYWYPVDPDLRRESAEGGKLLPGPRPS
jgi:hypothetical protein